MLRNGVHSQTGWIYEPYTKGTEFKNECRLALARARQLSLYLPGVILNPVRDDLRMMAPKPVAAKEGAMKDYEES